MPTKGASLDGKSAKFQQPTSKQIPKPLRGATPVFTVWDLEFLWSLFAYGRIRPLAEMLGFEIVRQLFGQSVDSFGQTKIKLGQAAFAVSREN
jgi:hypothetical protein